jgi:protein-tyrosine phosphatase
MPVKNSTKSVLFLCTGNYYRSRFAEELFNHHAELTSLNWTACSGALAIERGAVNVGPLSPHTLEALKSRGVRAVRATHYPRQCVLEDFEAADLIIALDEHEHRPLLWKRFSGWSDRVTYWHVKDVDAWHPADTIASIEREVIALSSILRGSNNRYASKRSSSDPA